MLSTVEETLGFDELVRDLLLAMVNAQNEANKSFIAGVDDLASTNVTIGYKKAVGEKTENREIFGSALAFGITPTILQIQSGVIELKTALSVTKNVAAKAADSSTVNTVKSKAGYLFKTAAVDAKCQNAYNYNAEASSTIRITVVPVPASQQLINTIKALTDDSPIVDSVKK